MSMGSSYFWGLQFLPPNLAIALIYNPDLHYDKEYFISFLFPLSLLPEVTHLSRVFFSLTTAHLSPMVGAGPRHPAAAEEPRLRRTLSFIIHHVGASHDSILARGL
jgi:hypothetical protein